MPPAIAPSEGPSAGAALSGPPPSVGVYVHFPWCIRKCGYCDFLSIAMNPADVPHGAYADAVLSELDRRRDQVGAHLLSTVFFGGGTPSLWRPAELGRVLAGIADAIPGLDIPEVTVECNPSSFDADKGRALREVGVNRISLGVQSLDAARLEFLGRLHDAEGGLRAVRDARAAGFDNVSADLIFGVAGQSAEDAVREALSVLDQGVTHLSVYALTVEPGTEFGALARKNRLPLLPEEAVAESFLALDEALETRGLTHYEISNYATPSREARHNLGYWRGRDYLGLGTGAWGTLGTPSSRFRYRNTQVPNRYLDVTRPWRDADLERAESGHLVTEFERISPDTALSERIMLGLRLRDGLDVAEAANETGAEAWTAARLRAVEKLVSRGRLERDGDRLRIPKESWLFADGVIAELL